MDGVQRSAGATRREPSRGAGAHSAATGADRPIHCLLALQTGTTPTSYECSFGPTRAHQLMRLTDELRTSMSCRQSRNHQRLGSMFTKYQPRREAQIGCMDLGTVRWTTGFRSCFCLQHIVVSHVRVKSVQVLESWLLFFGSAAVLRAHHRFLHFTSLAL